MYKPTVKWIVNLWTLLVSKIFDCYLAWKKWINELKHFNQWKIDHHDASCNVSNHLLLKVSINNSKYCYIHCFFNIHVKLLIFLNDVVKEHRTQGNSGKIKEGACWKTGIACQGPVSSWVFSQVLKYMLH